jgi:hypothetical protein
MPVGRRRKKRRKLTIVAPSLIEKPEILKPLQIERLEPKPAEPVLISTEIPFQGQSSGAILLKAMDYLIDGSPCFTEAIKSSLDWEDKGLLAKTEASVFLALGGGKQEGQSQALEKLWPLMGRRLSQQDVFSYLNYLQGVRTKISSVFVEITSLLQEVRCLKLTFADNRTLYLDGELRTAWLNPNIPDNFSVTISNIRSYIDRYFYKQEPLIFSLAPLDETLAKDFLRLMTNSQSPENKIQSLTLYNARQEQVDFIPLGQIKSNFLFGMWPWQFIGMRKVKKIGEFRPWEFLPLERKFYLAEIEIILSQLFDNKEVTLKGCAIKTSLQEKICLIILSSLDFSGLSIEEMAQRYIYRWPNLVEGFQDFSRKIEFFHYTASSDWYWPEQMRMFNLTDISDIQVFFNNYLKLLDLYLRTHYLPRDGARMDFSLMQEEIYNLEVWLEQKQGFSLATFQPKAEFSYQKELEYLLRRLNEREIILSGNKRVWFR